MELHHDGFAGIIGKTPFLVLRGSIRDPGITIVFSWQVVSCFIVIDSFSLNFLLYQKLQSTFVKDSDNTLLNSAYLKQLTLPTDTDGTTSESPADSAS